MTSPSNPLRWAGLALLTVATAVTSLAFTFALNDKTGLPIKWPAGSIPFRIMLGDTTTLSDGLNYNTSARAAAQTWNAVLGSVQFQTELIAAGAPVDNNKLNEVGFAATYVGKEFGENVIAVTTGYSVGNKRTEADIYFRSTESWDSYRGSLRNAEDIQRVVIHEFGHALGLSHPDENGQSVNAIMNSLVSNVDALTSDDIQGGQSLYGSPGIPANDNFANAFTISLTDTGTVLVKGVNTNATKQSGEPNHAGNIGGRSVWWKWTPPTAGAATITTAGSYFDTTLAIYTGTSVSSLTSIASHDDIDPGVVQWSNIILQVKGGTTYYIAIDGFDGDSAGISLNVAYRPGETLAEFTAHPSSLTVTVGGSASFSVTATGPGTLTYQWLFNGNTIPGATSPTLTLTNVQTTNAGSYSVGVSNSAGQVVSNLATLTIVSTPVVTSQPSNQTVTAGNSTFFSVIVTGGGPLTYQWFLNGNAINGATSSTYNLTGVTSGQAGTYSVRVTNPAGSVTSNGASLTVTAAASPPTSGGGGGGAPSLWFCAVLAALGASRWVRQRR